jgi:hypothetical protein
MSTIPALILLDLGYNFRACGMADTLYETFSLIIATAINGLVVAIFIREQNYVGGHLSVSEKMGGHRCPPVVG